MSMPVLPSLDRSSPSPSSSLRSSSSSLRSVMTSPSPSPLCSPEMELSWCRTPPALRRGFHGISAPPHRRTTKKTAGFSPKSCFHSHGSRTMKSGPSPSQNKGTAAPVYLFFDFFHASAPRERRSVSCHSSTDESVTSSPSSSSFSSSSSSPSSSISREENGSSKELIAEGLGTFQKETQSLWLETAEDRNEDGDFLQRDLTSAQIYGKNEQVYDGEDLVAEEGEQQTIHSGFKMEVYEKSNDISSPSSPSSYSSFDSVIPLKEPIYEVLEVKPGGAVFTKSISRRQLLKSSGLRLRDIRSVDPSLWITNSAPALLVRDQAILLNLGSLRAIGTPENVLIFDHKSIGAAAFLEILLQRLKPESNPGVPTMPFELEVVESALLSRTQRLERWLMEIEPKVLTLLEVLPNRLTANFLEELRLSKQALVELGSKSGALRQMILELLESPQEIRRMTIMGRRCTIKKEDGTVQCEAWSDKRSADDEEEEIEMLLENYLQRCESCHGQAERLLDSAKEMEDSIAVNLSSRRLEVSRLELLLQVGTFCSALGALLAGIFGMNLKSYLETSAIAFWITTGGIIFGGIILFFIMYNHLKRRKIL